MKVIVRGDKILDVPPVFRFPRFGVDRSVPLMIVMVADEAVGGEGVYRTWIVSPSLVVGHFKLGICFYFVCTVCRCCVIVICHQRGRAAPAQPAASLVPATINETVSFIIYYSSLTPIYFTINFLASLCASTVFYV